MTQNLPLISLDTVEIHRQQASLIKERIGQKLQESLPGHCLRISTLPETASRALCAELNALHFDADIVLLLGARQSPTWPWEVSATRLIELRNDAKRPLLAFIPPGQKAAAEDSFDISTFADIELGDIPTELSKKLRENLPAHLKDLTDHILQYLKSLKFTPEYDEIARYYLTLQVNGYSLEAAGGALYQLRLLPDFAIASTQISLGQRLDRNLTSL
jgi:hypothetical protein